MQLVLDAVAVRRGSAHEHQSYAASLSFGDIARLLEDNRLCIPNDPDLDDLAQRKPNPTRIKVIAQYILSTYQSGTTFFPPICVNVQPPPTYRDGRIYLPYSSVTMRLTDGQHRCFGIHRALQNLEAQDIMATAVLTQLEIGVLIYAGLSLEDERQAFRDQNLLVQRPSTSLSHHFDRRSPTVHIAKEVIHRVPQFRNNVEKVENGLGKHNPKLMTLSTLVNATQHMFPNLQSKTGIEPLIDWAATFWAATASVLPDNPWQVMTKEERRQQREASLVSTAVVVQALGLLARDLYTEELPEEDLRKWLMQLQDIDWQRSSAFWRERGVTQLGSKGEAIIQNTRTTVNLCHKVLQEKLGLLAEGILQ